MTLFRTDSWGFQSYGVAGTMAPSCRISEMVVTGSKSPHNSCILKNHIPECTHSADRELTTLKRCLPPINIPQL